MLGKNKNMKLKGAIIGISGYGNAHYNDLLAFCKESVIDLCGATVINRKDEAEKCAILESMGCKIYDDYLVMLKDLSGKIDFCTIPTGIPMHREMTICALQNNINCLVEKPATTDMMSLKDMIEAEKNSKSFAAVGFQYNYHQTTHHLKQLLLSGALGKIKALKGYCLWPRTNQYYQRNNWAGKRVVNNIIVNDAPFSNATAHYLMLLLFLAGSTFDTGAMPIDVTGKLLKGNPQISSCDTAELHYLLDNNLKLDYYCSHSCLANKGPLLKIECGKGVIFWTLEKITIKTEFKEENIPVRTGNFESKEEMWRAFFSKVAGKNSFVTNLTLAQCHTKAVELAFNKLDILIPETQDLLKDEKDNTIRYVIPNFYEKAIKEVES